MTRRKRCRRAARLLVYAAALSVALADVFQQVEAAATGGGGGGAAARLAKPGSTHPSFPMDAFAKPAYRLVFKEDDPVGNQTAIQLLQSGTNYHHHSGKVTPASGLETYGREDQSSANQDGSRDTNAPRRRYKSYLHRSAPDQLHICTLEEPPAPPKALQLDEQGLQQYREQVLRRALELLSPLKETCLFHTLDWFTYSMCYGDAVKQFRALPTTLGGGKTPAMDPSQDSYVLGRWNSGVEAIRGNSHESKYPTRPAVGNRAHIGAEDETQNRQTTLDGSSSPATASPAAEHIEQGTELMELVHFSSIEGSESSGRRFRLSDNGPSQTAIEGRGRYISQTWTDGTLCNINNEPRTTEVQFHCAKTPPVDRISLIKEVTTCNYVVVVETPRLCAEPALAQAEDDVREVKCRPILSDSELHERYQQKNNRAQASLSGDVVESSKDKTASPRNAESGVKTPPEVPSSVQEEDNNLPKEEMWLDAEGGSDAEAGSLKSQLASIISQLRAGGGQTAGDQILIDEVQVVVGMDEEGNMIVEPRIEPASARSGAGGGASGGEGAANADAAANGGQDTPLFPAERWKEIMQQIKELQGGIRGADGTVYEVVEDGGGAAAGANAGGEQGRPTHGQEDAARPGKDRKQAAPQQQQTPAKQQQQQQQQQPVPPPPTNNAAAAAQGQQARRGAGHATKGNMMVREPESFAQRVERHFKAQEERERKENEKKHGDSSAQQQNAALHDEL